MIQIKNTNYFNAKDMEQIMPKRDFIFFLLMLGCVTLFLYLTGIGCPILYVTGISCPSCGMTRACLHLLQLDLPGAIHYHPLCFTLPFLAVLILFQNKIPKKVFYFFLFVMLLLFLSVYLFRLSDPSDEIVIIDIRNGLVYRILLQTIQRAAYLFSFIF